MVMEGGNGIHAAAQAPPANPTEGPDASRVAREFVRQYYTILHSSPVHLHRFYNEESEFIHGSIDTPSKSVRGQQDIHRAIMALNFRECYAKIHYVDAQESENKMVVVQVAGQLTNQGGPMRRFMQTFILVQLSARKYYVRNDIFRYQDQVFEEEEEVDDVNKVTQDDQAHEQPIFNGGAGSDHVTLNGEHATETAAAAAAATAVATAAKEDNQWDNSMAAQAPPAPTVQAAQSTPNPTTPTQTTSSVATNSATSQETVPSAPRSWSQMLQVKKTTDPVSPPANQTPFGPPNSSTTFGGSVPSQGLSQRPPHRGGNTRANGSNAGPTPPKELPANSPHSKEEETSPGSKPYIPDNQQLFVRNIPTNVSDKTLIEFFSKYGKVHDFRLSVSKNVSGGTAGSKAGSSNFGFVVFDSSETVHKVLEEAQNASITWELEGKPVRLNIEEKKTRPLGASKGPRGLNNGQRGGERRQMPNGGWRRDFNSRPPRTGPPRQGNAGTGNVATGQSGPGQQQPQAQQAQH